MQLFWMIGFVYKIKILYMINRSLGQILPVNITMTLCTDYKNNPESDKTLKVAKNIDFTLLG